MQKNHNFYRKNILETGLKLVFQAVRKSFHIIWRCAFELTNIYAPMSPPHTHTCVYRKSHIAPPPPPPPLWRLIEYIKWPFAYKIKKVHHSQCKLLLGNVNIYLRCFALQGRSPKIKQNSPPFNRWFLVESMQICFPQVLF